jgi:hypothetical protein
MQSKEEPPVTLIDGVVFDDDTTEGVSDAVVTVGWNSFSLYVWVQSEGDGDHSLEIVRQISPVLDGVEWYDCAGVWGAAGEYSNLVVSAADAQPEDFKKVYFGRCIGMRARLKVVASGTTAEKRLRLRAKIQLW